jgi:hypothetical protein
MKFTFAQDWHNYKVGDRVPASVNRAYLLRHGIIKRYSHVEALEAEQVEVKEAILNVEAPKPQPKGKKK